MTPNQQRIISSNQARAELCRANFYSKENLQDLLNMFLADKALSNYISTYSIHPDQFNIQLQIRKSYNMMDTSYGSFDLYEDQHIKRIMMDFYLKHKIEIFSIIGVESGSTFLDMRYLDMYYYITRYGENTVIINFT